MVEPKEYQSKDMPSKTWYCFLIVLGFLCGILWGALALGSYSRMKAAIIEGSEDAAWGYAKRIRIFTAIGLVINALSLFIMTRA